VTLHDSSRRASTNTADANPSAPSSTLTPKARSAAVAAGRWGACGAEADVAVTANADGRPSERVDDERVISCDVGVLICCQAC